VKVPSSIGKRIYAGGCRAGAAVIAELYAGEAAALQLDRTVKLRDQKMMR
jgi:hypothetical protein